jgi:hypothetical protein
MTNALRQLLNYSCLAVLSAVIVVFVFCVPLKAKATPTGFAGDTTNRPAGVPEDYVITPFGYFHPSCVRMLAEGQTLLADGRIQYADGRVEATVPVCNYPHYTSAGAIVSAYDKGLSGMEPEINGWLEYVSVTTNTSYGEISASWAVPPGPTAEDGQTLFFFPGFEDRNDVISIVQPVLQFGPSAAGGGAFWAIASWNCCPSGIAVHSSLLDVSSGDTVVGTISPNCKPGKDYCPTWNVVSEDKTKGKKTTLAKTPAEKQIWNWAFGAVSEDYGVVQCGDFPADSGLTFTVHLYNQSGKLIPDPGWVGTPPGSGETPKCKYGVKTTKTLETVEY